MTATALTYPVPQAPPAAWPYTLLERGLLPEALIRLGIRRQLAQKQQELRFPTAEAEEAYIQQFLTFLATQPIAIDTDAANEQHYELPPAFFELVLGERKKYSCGYWAPGVTTLADAEAAMLNLYVERAGLKNGQRILDLGCGWGALSLFLAERFPDSPITGLSNSTPQRNWILARAQEKGLHNLNIVTANIATHQPDDWQFDRIVSIEMMEHMRNYPALFTKLAGWLVPGGQLFVHIFTHRRVPYLFEDDAQSPDWLTRYFFRGGTMPSHHLLAQVQQALTLTHLWAVDGTHYAKTAEAWLQRHHHYKPQLLDLFEDTYGSEADAKRWWHRWQAFWLACAELWAYDEGREWFVSHYLFEKPRTVAPSHV